MSQSASFYSIAATDFLEIKKCIDKDLDLSPYIKDHCTLQGTFMGLEYTMVTGQDEDTTTLIEELFNPSESYGGVDFNDIDIDTINPEELEELVLNDASVYYIPPATIGDIANLLNSIDESTINDNYDAEALNENDIYPGVWTNNELPETAYNKSQLVNDYRQLKAFILNAAAEKNYVLTYVG